MTMTTWKRNRTGSVLIAGAAAALMVGASAAPALAATTWTVKPGGTITAKSGTTTLKDTKTGQKLSCSSSAAKATLKKGSHLSGTGLGSITAISFSNCTGPLKVPFTVKSSHLPWKLNAVSYSRSTGTTTGTITGIHATLTGTSCSAIVDGSTGATKNNGMVHVTYGNKTHKLTVLASGGNLHIYNVKGCFGLIKSGDGSSFTATYTVSPAQTITSP